MVGGFHFIGSRVAPAVRVRCAVSRIGRALASRAARGKQWRTAPTAGRKVGQGHVSL